MLPSPLQHRGFAAPPQAYSTALPERGQAPPQQDESQHCSENTSALRREMLEKDLCPPLNCSGYRKSYLNKQKLNLDRKNSDLKKQAAAFSRLLATDLRC